MIIFLGLFFIFGLTLSIQIARFQEQRNILKNQVDYTFNLAKNTVRYASSIDLSSETAPQLAAKTETLVRECLSLGNYRDDLNDIFIQKVIESRYTNFLAKCNSLAIMFVRATTADIIDNNSNAVVEIEYAGQSTAEYLQLINVVYTELTKSRADLSQSEMSVLGYTSAYLFNDTLNLANVSLLFMLVMLLVTFIQVYEAEKESVHKIFAEKKQNSKKLKKKSKISSSRK